MDTTHPGSTASPSSSLQVQIRSTELLVPLSLTRSRLTCGEHRRRERACPVPRWRLMHRRRVPGLTGYTVLSRVVVVLREFPPFRSRPMVDGCRCGSVASATIGFFETASGNDVPRPRNDTRNDPIEHAGATVLRSRHDRRRARSTALPEPGAPGTRVAEPTPRETHP